ncbi:MAG TPA: YrvL family regulatory protein [Pseudogracilibacillus sp.]|nr:YrvL family regulatory protein [Pseudogracilibacillus sp.]
MNVKKIIGFAFLSIFVCVTLIAVFSIFYTTIGGLFVLFNVEYDSLWSLGYFVGLLFIIGLFTELLFGGLITFAMAYARTKLEGMTIEFGLNFVENLIVLMLVNIIVQSVVVPPGVILIMAVLLAIGSCVLESKYKLVENNGDM